MATLWKRVPSITPSPSAERYYPMLRHQGFLFLVHQPEARSRMAVRTWALGPFLAAILGACSLGPSWKSPDLDIPAAFRATPASAQTAWPSAEWWRDFNQPELTELMEEAKARNFDIAAAIARVRQADAQARVSGAPLLPASSLSGGHSWNQTARTKNGASGVSVGAGNTILTPGEHTNEVRQYNISDTISYELDFWGKNRATFEAAKESAQYSRFDQATVALTTTAAVATTYFNILGFQARVAIAEDNLRQSEETLKVIRARFEAGTASLLDVSQQEALVEGLRANVPALRSQLEQQVISLGLLVGRPPEMVSVKGGSLEQATIPQPAPGLPVDLVARRPDIAAAEAQLASANANIKVARAKFFPSFTLTASGGFQALTMAYLFTPQGQIASLSTSVAQTVFDNGVLFGNLDIAKGRYEELLATYRKTVVQAFTDVENAITSYRYATEQEAMQRKAVEVSRRAADVARAQLLAGVIDVTALLQAQQTLFSNQATLAQVRLSRFEAVINLYKALGGGWTRLPAPGHKI
ncbi:Type I secretion outer membrane protein [Granulibacter bethesdensis]|nr:Type I secretion outer membrane protein [Granulibacter bethesdensis]